jgi:hypothetical protein
MPVTVDRPTGEHVASATPAGGSARVEKGALGANLFRIRRALDVVETLARALIGIGHGTEVRAHATAAGSSSARGLSLLTAAAQSYEQRSSHRNSQPL